MCLDGDCAKSLRKEMQYLMVSVMLLGLCVFITHSSRPYVEKKLAFTGKRLKIEHDTKRSFWFQFWLRTKSEI